MKLYKKSIRLAEFFFWQGAPFLPNFKNELLQGAPLLEFGQK